MKCIICQKDWDEVGAISGTVHLATETTPRSFSMDNQPICAKCLAGMTKAMADNALAAVVAVDAEKKKRSGGYDE